jgi:hypothetical protein
VIEGKFQILTNTFDLTPATKDRYNSSKYSNYSHILHIEKYPDSHNDAPILLDYPRQYQSDMYGDKRSPILAIFQNKPSAPVLEDNSDGNNPCK